MRDTFANCPRWRHGLAISIVPLLFWGCGQAPSPALGARETPRYDLAAHLELSDKWTQTTAIDFGRPDQRKFLLSGWSFDEVWEADLKFIWGVGDRSELRFFHFQPGELSIRLTCRPLMGSDGPYTTAVDVVVNGSIVSRVDLMEDAFTSHLIELPSQTVRLGENRLVLEYRGRRGTPSVSPAESRDLRVAWSELELDSVEVGSFEQGWGNGRAGVIDLAAGTQLDFFVDLPSGSAFVWESIRAWNVLGQAPLVFEVEVANDDGKRQVIEIPLEGDVTDTGKRPIEGVTGFSRVSLRLVDPGRNERHPIRVRAALVNPELTGPDDPADLIARKGAPNGSREEADKGSVNVVLYLVDTLRSDSLGAYGRASSTSPHIDRFASESTVFTDVLAQSSWTKTSVASILTGLLPDAHLTNEREDVLPAAIPSLLPVMLRDAGYETVAFSASSVISPAFGFDYGFEEFSLVEPDTGERFVSEYSDVVTDRFEAWLGTRRDLSRPFFAYVHTMDPHDPYGPPWTYGSSREAAAFRSIPLRRPRENEIAAFLASDQRFSVADVRAHFLELYDHDISYNDIQFGRLIDLLRDEGLLESTVIVLVSDHGEEFLEHGHWAHGRTLYREQVSVPLVIRLPTDNRLRRTVDHRVQHVDILPTILDALGREVPAEIDGRSLIPLMRGQPPAEEAVGRPVFSALRLDGVHVESVAYREYRLIRWNPGADAEQLELFEVASDRAEMQDLASNRPAAAGYLASLLDELGRRPGPGYGAVRHTLDDETEERLRALGYID